MVVGPLIFMLFSIIELGVIFLLTATLDNATADTARTIRTGAVQTAGNSSATTIRDSICSKLGWLAATCHRDLSVDVRTYAQFNNPTAPNPINNGAWDESALTYNPGAAGEIVMVRAYYRWKLLTPFLNFGGMQKLGTGEKLVMSAATFRNEPF